ncbi:MAG: OadG family protein [Desulfobacterales bacterium]|nr:OadG family protein [Desulfobacterales bacterium]
MFSFELISANNGWAMALAGALIVMTGLTVLSFIISQLHRLVELIEKKEAVPEDTGADRLPEKFPDNLDKVAALYEPLAQQLPASFGLEALYALTQENNYPHPHLTIRSFRESGILIAQGEGQFSWKTIT